jgi:hypothetical protein
MIFIFVTAKTYTQLGIAVILYPLLAYFALKVLPRKNANTPAITIQIPSRPVQTAQGGKHEKVEVADIDKRTFLKLIGSAGISFLLFSILGRRLDSLLFGGALNSGINTGGTGAGNQAAQAAQPTEGFKISEIDDSGAISYYGFVNQDGGWLIMKQDSDTSSFRYVKGNLNFSGNWGIRETLKYDYYYKLF